MSTTTATIIAYGKAHPISSISYNRNNDAITELHTYIFEMEISPVQTLNTLNFHFIFANDFGFNVGIYEQPTGIYILAFCLPYNFYVASEIWWNFNSFLPLKNDEKKNEAALKQVHKLNDPFYVFFLCLYSHFLCLSLHEYEWDQSSIYSGFF